MNRNVLLSMMLLCVAHIGFAQLEVSNLGNASIGNVSPLSDTKLYLDCSTPTADAYGLYSFLEHTNATTNGSLGRPTLYGAYFKNEQSGPSGSFGHSYGIKVSNKNYTSNSTIYGVSVSNDISGASSGNSYGFHAINNSGGIGAATYGLYAKNTSGTGAGGGVVYGAYLDNALTNGSSGTVYGIYSTNVSSILGTVYGAYLSAQSPNNSAYVRGLYVTVSGPTDSKRYAGYFTGGKVVLNGDVGIGKDPVIGRALDVSGGIWVNNVQVHSDERLKSDIKPLSDEKDKLYLLQGKSYKKMLPPTGLEEDSLAEKREIVEIPEYGYLAQELKDIFPDLVDQDTSDYYSINYIGLIPVIVEALKDQRLESEKKQIQIDEQREQIKQLIKLMDIKSINEKAFEENGIESIPILLQNTPNPFNQATEIGYYIPESVNSANIYIYDVSGFQQRNISISERGKGATILQASALQAGIYFYTLICDGKPVDTKQMILTR